MSKERIWEMWRVQEEFHYLYTENFGIWNDKTNQRRMRGIFLEEVNRHGQSLLKSWHVAQHLIKIIMARLKTQWYAGQPLNKGAIGGELKRSKLQFVHVVVQVKKTRMTIPNETVIHKQVSRPWGKYMDDPQHLGKFQVGLSTKTRKLNHVLLFQAMSKTPVHHYIFLLNT